MGNTAQNQSWYEKNKEKHKKDVRKNAKRYDARYKALTDALKDVPCMDCGGRFPPVCMDFDHIADDKANNVASMNRHSLEKLMAEIAKCEIVCANCHRVRTSSRRSQVEKAVVS